MIWALVIVLSLPVLLFVVGFSVALAERWFGALALGIERCFEAVVRGIDGFVVALILALKGTTRGLIDLTGGVGRGWSDYPASLPSQPRRTSSVVHPGYERFEAFTQCPTCSDMHFHLMREPVRGTGEPVHEVRAFSGQVIFQYGTRDESGYDVIRICSRCGQEWGQR